MNKRLTREFYQRDVLEVAPEMLGKVLVRVTSDKEQGTSRASSAGVITEVEAYRGEEDLACHARFGRTERTEVMYGEAGRVYVYLIYGMYWMLNIVTGEVNQPQAVLIRGLSPFNYKFQIPNDKQISNYKNQKSNVKNQNDNAKSKKDEILKPFVAQGYGWAQRVQDDMTVAEKLDGPGKVGRWLGLDKSFYGEAVTQSKRIWIEEGSENVKVQMSNDNIKQTPRIGVSYAGEWAGKPWRWVWSIK